MENKRNIKIFILKCLFVLAVFGLVLNLPFKLKAYNDTMVHPALTEEVVKFYNLNFSSNKISDQEMNWIRRGSIEEDTGIRSLNHFYDPVHNVGLKGMELSAKNWSQNTLAQAQKSATYYLAGFFKNPFNHSTDYSWDRALYDYAKGNKERAYIALGHIVHLIEDMTVPDHTRDDAHPPVGGMGSPYESWTKRFNKNLGIAVNLKDQNYAPIILSNLNSYFDKNANYSNNNFFSRDTINDSNFSKPPLNQKMHNSSTGEDFFISEDENGKKFLLVRYLIKRQNDNFKISYYLVDSKDSVLSDYWTHLSKQAVLSGAGVINLFFQEAEKIKNDPKFVNADQSTWDKLLNSLGAYFFSFFNGTNQNNGASNDAGANSSILTALDGINLNPSPSPALSGSPFIVPPSPMPSASQTTSPAFPGPSYSASVAPTPTPTSYIIYGGGGSGSSQASSSENPSPTPSSMSSPQATLSPSPSPELSLASSPTLTPTPTPSVIQTPTLSPSPTLTPELFPTPSPELSPTPTPAPTPEPSSTLSPEPSPTPSPSPSSEPSISPSPSPSPESSPSPTPTLSPSPTPSSDTIPPEKPTITTNGGENFTSTSTPIFLEGTNSEDSDKLFINGNEDGILRASSTLWKKLIDLLAGENIFEIFAKDAAGNEGEKSSIIINFDSSAPTPILNFVDVDFVVSKFSIEYSTDDKESDFQSFELNLKQDNEDWQDLTSQIDSEETEGALNYEGQANKNYTVRLRAKDTKGNISDWVEKSITLIQKPIVFSEFAWAGTKASPNDEWIELYNLTDYPVDLTDWKLYAADLSPDITFVGGDNTDKTTINKIIEPHGYYLLERKNGNDETDQTISNIFADWWGSFGSGLNNNGEVMRLKNPAGFEVDKITPNGSSGWFAGNVSTRASMEKVVMEENGNDFRNWLAFSGASTAQDAKGDVVLGSPKSENSVHNKYHQLNGTLSQDTILTSAKSPYWIYDILSVPENIKLTIGPGVIIKFTTGDGHQRIDIKGTLDARGNEANKVVFTSFRDDEYGGDTNNDGALTVATQGTWKYVHLFPQSKNNKISYAVFRYGGATFNGAGNDSGMLNVDNTSVDILGSVFEHALWKGLWAQNSLVNIENSSFQNSTSTPSQPFAYGSLYQDGGKVNISGSRFVDNRLAIYASGNSGEDLLSIKNSYFSKNKTATQISIPIDFGNDNTAENNDYNGFLMSGLPVGLNITWGGNVPFIIPSTLSIPNTSQLTIKAGTTIKFKAFDSWFLAMGRLSVDGEDGNPVVFTSIKDDSAGGDTNNDGSATLPNFGDWRSVQLENVSATSTIRYAQMRYGGTHLNGTAQHSLFYANNSPVEIYNSQFRDSKFANVNISGGSAIIKGSEFSNARNSADGSHVGLELSTYAPIVLENNTFYNNKYGISATTSRAPEGVNAGSLIFSDNDHDTSPIGWLGLFE